MSSRQPKDYRPDIQGLRAIAVVSVVLYHAHVPFLPGGYVGVDIFFVISGFLISGHLLKSLEETGRIDLVAFWARRARRLLPAALAVVMLTVVAALILVPPLAFTRVMREAIATIVYAPNVLFAVEGTNYLSDTTPSLFQHYWSLGVEEQFYLLWPLAFWAAFVAVRTRAQLITLLALLFGLSLAACVVLTNSSNHQAYAFFLLPTRAWEFGAGALVALLFVTGVREGRLSVSRGISGALRIAGLVLILGSVMFYDKETVFPGYAAIIPVLGTALVIAAGSPGERHPLTSRPAEFLGEISYSLYLVHWPVLLIPLAVAGYRTSVSTGMTLALAAACVPIAWVLFNAIEDRGRRWVWLSHARSSRTFATAALCMVLVASSSVIADRINDARRLDSGQASAESGALARPPIVTADVPSNLTPSLRESVDSVPVLYATGCHRDFASTDSTGCTFGRGTRTVALFGDSHAAQWFPALASLATKHDLTITTYTKSSCPSVAVATRRNTSSYKACDVWRRNVLRHLATNRPALVLVANFSSFASVSLYSPSSWEEGLKSTIGALHGVPVAVVVDTPDMGVSPAICLSSHLLDAAACGVPRSDALNSPLRGAEARATSSERVPMVDLLDYMCAPRFCPAIVGNTLVYRDAHHLTVPFSERLAGPLWANIAPLIEPPAGSGRNSGEHPTS